MTLAAVLSEKQRRPAFPAPATLAGLFAGGLAGLLAWEIWARLLAPLVIGGPLEPHGLVIALGNAVFGIGLSKGMAMAIHFAVGIAGYPLAYWIVSRMLPRWGALFDGGVWLVFSGYVGWLAMAGKVSGPILLLWALVTILSASRLLNRSALLADAISWGNFTWFNALGIMAPLAGMPFLLIGAADKLSLMSWAGHVIYGAVAVVSYELWMRFKGR